MKVTGAACLVSLCVLGCHASEPKRPNIIVISLDTLRADHLATYGYHRTTSPFIARFAARATVFRNAISPSAWTMPAHASILLSQYPFAHGVTNVQSRIDPGAVQGRSLVPLTSGWWKPKPVAVLSASDETTALNAVIRGQWKLIKGSGGTELFDLEADADERKNLVGEHPQRAQELEAELLRLMASSGSISRSREQVPLDAATREQLRALGYLE